MIHKLEYTYDRLEEVWELHTYKLLKYEPGSSRFELNILGSTIQSTSNNKQKKKIYITDFLYIKWCDDFIINKNTIFKTVLCIVNSYY